MSAFVSHVFAAPRLRSGRATCAHRRVFHVARMSDTAPGTDTEVFASEEPASPPVTNGAAETVEEATEQSFNAPSFDTAVFSNFVQSAQSKVDELSAKVQEVDPTEVLNESKTNAIGLVDNFLAGDWLNRGELYGAIQIVLVLLLLRGPGVMDSVIGFLVGPATLAVGAAISGKALWDLGRKQISIWPAPVPDAELRTDGLYGVVRHPMYSGLLLASTGFAVSTGSPERFAVVVAMAYFLGKKIDVEESFLAGTYDGWEEYVEKVKHKLIPNLW